MIDDCGNHIDNDAILDRVLAIGAIVIRREPVESADFGTWRAQLRRAGKTHGIRIATNILGDRVLVHNPDHVVTDAQRRAVITAVADLSTPEPEPTVPVRTPRTALRLITDTAPGPGSHRR